MTDLTTAAPTVNHPFRYVNGCGEHGRTIFTPDGGVTIHIGCSVYTPEAAREAITDAYADRPELMIEYLAAVDRLVNDDIPFDSENYNWDTLSQIIVRRAPHLFDPERFNWKWYSDALVQYAPHHFDPERFNWEGCSWDVVCYAPELFDPDRFNWAVYSWAVVQHAPQCFDPDRFNWDDAAWAVIEYAPELYAQYKDRVDAHINKKELVQWPTFQ